jgi:hypothetical protein
VPCLCRHGDQASDAVTLDWTRSRGFPLILWSRQAEHENCYDFSRRAADLLVQSGTVQELLHRLRVLRGHAMAGNPDAVRARHLGVFYDPAAPEPAPAPEPEPET